MNCEYSPTPVKAMSLGRPVLQPPGPEKRHRLLGPECLLRREDWGPENADHQSAIPRNSKHLDSHVLLRLHGPQFCSILVYMNELSLVTDVGVTMTWIPLVLPEQGYIYAWSD